MKASWRPCEDCPGPGAGCLSARGQALRPTSCCGLALAERQVAATEVANRAGHSVEVLLRVYAKCIDGGEESANRRIDEALGA